MCPKFSESHIYLLFFVSCDPFETCDANKVVSADDAGTICVWDIYFGETIFRFRKAHDGKIATMVFDDTGRRLISGADDGKVKIWNYNIGHCLACYSPRKDEEASLKGARSGSGANAEIRMGADEVIM